MSNWDLFLFLVTMCCLRSLVKGEYEGNTSIPKPLSLEQKWENMEKSLKGLVSQGLKIALPVMMNTIGKTNVSSSCVSDTLRLFAGVKKTKTWAMHIIGANAGIVTGMAFQTLSAVGAYDQCINSEVKNEYGKSKGEILFRGKYCTVDVTPPLSPKPLTWMDNESPIELKNFSSRDTILGDIASYANVFRTYPYRVGICVPSGCSKSDVGQLVKSVSESISMPVHVNWCELKEANKFTPLVISILTVYAFVMSLVIAGTLIDYFWRYAPKYDDFFFLKVLLSFSIKRNSKRLFNISTLPGDLSCLHGIRVASMSWIILGHTYLFMPLNATRGVPLYLTSFRGYAFTIILRGNLSVETFFVISGILSSYVLIEQMKDAHKPRDFLVFILYRVWRLLPSMIFVILFVFIWDLFGSGPIWRDIIQERVQGCYESWWKDIIFINNLYSVYEKLCLPHFWYLASDMQLYISSLVILFLLAKRSKCGVILAVGCILASMIATAAITFQLGYPPALTLANPNENLLRNWSTSLHFKPYPHAAAYSVGILSGYLLIKKPKLKISKIYQVLGWCIFTVCITSVCFGISEWNKGVHASFLETLFFSSCSLVTWGLAMAWMILCCATGHGGLINVILSWKLWIPLGRLTYSAYLIHPLVQILFTAITRTERSIYHVTIVWEFFGYLLVTYGIALIMYLAIESPFVSLGKLFLFGGKIKSSPPQQGEEFNMENKRNPENNLSTLPQNSLETEGTENPGFVQKL